MLKLLPKVKRIKLGYSFRNHNYVVRGPIDEDKTGRQKMNNFFKGILFGVGIGLLVAPMRGEEMRRVVSERVNERRGYLPENEQLSQYTQQVSDRVSQTASSLKDYAQQASTTVKSAASNLSNITQSAASDVKQTGKDVADQTRATVNSSNTTTNI